MILQWYGTASILIKEEDTSVLFDPFVSMNEKIDAFSPEIAADVSNILITHGHFDHLVDVPAIIQNTDKSVYCSKTAAETLLNCGVNAKQIHTISPGDKFQIGSFKFRVLEGKHIKFDLKLILKTLFNARVVKYKENLKKILRENRKYPAGEVLVFEIEANGKKLLHMGSLNLDENEVYPQEADVLTIPFQGRSDISEYFMKFVKKLKPKAIYLQHFDDTFPPVSSAVDLQELKEEMSKSFPHIKVIIPEYGEAITV